MRSFDPGVALFPARRRPAHRITTLMGQLAKTLVLVALAIGWPLSAAGSPTGGADPLAATGSPAARQSAIDSIPMNKLGQAEQAKVRSVLSNITVFRRMPTRVVSCDPDLYLLLVRHPDVMVNIWEVLGLSQLRLRQTGEGKYQVTETDGMTATLDYLYQSHDRHIVFGQWTYNGALLTRPIGGRCLAILTSAYVRETDGRYYVTNRLDTFLSVDPGGVELLTKTLHPLVVKTADANFVQVVAFVGSLSRTAEVNSRAMQRLAAKLTHVQPEVRQSLANISASVGQKSASLPAPKLSATDAAQLAVRPGESQR